MMMIIMIPKIVSRIIRFEAIIYKKWCTLENRVPPRRPGTMMIVIRELLVAP